MHWPAEWPSSRRTSDYGVIGFEGHTEFAIQNLPVGVMWLLVIPLALSLCRNNREALGPLLLGMALP